MDPIIEEMPTNARATSQQICPWPECGEAGDWKPSPAGMVALANSGYEVQPEAAAPPSTKKLMRMTAKAGHMNQYDIMFSLGNAMSRAPIMSGMVKLPNAPVSSGIITKKIMIDACMLKIMA